MFSDAAFAEEVLNKAASLQPDDPQWPDQLGLLLSLQPDDESAPKAFGGLRNGQREPVLRYFELCRKFWKMGGERLDEWTKDVNAGRAPDLGGNLAY
jgi:hypothetical protein